MIPVTPCTLEQPHHFALGPCLGATRGGAVAHAARRISIADAVAERSSDPPQRAPDLDATVRLAQRHSRFDLAAPRIDILKRDGARIAIAEHRLDPFPSAPPILTCARLLAISPLRCVAIAPERL